MALDTDQEQLSPLSIRSLERRVHLWNFQKNGHHSLHNSQLVQRLWVLFYDMGLNDKEILRFLAKDGHEIGSRM